MLSAVEQGELFTVAQPVSTDISDAVIKSQPTMTAAISLSVQASGLADKQVYIPLCIDKGQWSRIMSGIAHFPSNKYIELFDITGNEVPLRWLALMRGYELVPLVSELETQVAEKDKQISDLNNKLEHYEEFIRIQGGKK